MFNLSSDFCSVHFRPTGVYDNVPRLVMCFLQLSLYVILSSPCWAFELPKHTVYQKIWSSLVRSGHKLHVGVKIPRQNRGNVQLMFLWAWFHACWQDYFARLFFLSYHYLLIITASPQGFTCRLRHVAAMPPERSPTASTARQ